MKNTHIPIGILRNNPLNIRKTNTTWKGEIVSPLLQEESEEARSRDSEFVHFSSMEYGLRAAFCILRTYARIHHVYSPAGIIRRWAPPSENNTERYIRNVCLWTGFGGQQRLAETDWPKLVKAMARQECGVMLDDELINRAFCLYKRKA